MSQNYKIVERLNKTADAAMYPEGSPYQGDSPFGEQIREAASLIKELGEALETARQFISNGVELGFIRMPDRDDPALDTLPKISAILSKLNDMTDETIESREMANTDTHLWPIVSETPYAPSIHVTAQGSIGINVGCLVIVKPIEEWHALATADLDRRTAELRARLAMVPRSNWLADVSYILANNAAEGDGKARALLDEINALHAAPRSDDGSGLTPSKHGFSAAAASLSRDVERIEGQMFSVEYAGGPDEYARKPGVYVTIYLDVPAFDVDWSNRPVIIERSRLLPAAASEQSSNCEAVTNNSEPSP